MPLSIVENVATDSPLHPRTAPDQGGVLRGAAKFPPAAANPGLALPRGLAIASDRNELHATEQDTPAKPFLNSAVRRYPSLHPSAPFSIRCVAGSRDRYPSAVKNIQGLLQRVMAKADGVSVALDERDPFTHAHCDRVAGLSLELGVQCGLLERDLEHLGMAAGFHDVGKIGIPDAVLRKKGALSDAEWVLMKSHATRSERIMLAAFLDDGDLIAPAVRHHHERFDGQGYPTGLHGRGW